MTLRSVLLSAVVVSASFLALSAQAHDPRLHEAAAAEPKAKPTTCAQLADTQKYSSDLADADIKALKAKCNAEKKAPAKAGKSK
jgi:hypothetical protein